MTAVGFEPTQLALVELESTPLDHSGKLSMSALLRKSIQCLVYQACVDGRGSRLEVFSSLPKLLKKLEALGMSYFFK